MLMHKSKMKNLLEFRRLRCQGPAPVAHTDNLPHAVVFALPLKDDGKIYTGQVTFTASKPIEVEVLHIYRPEQPPDEIHGSLLQQ